MQGRQILSKNRTVNIGAIKITQLVKVFVAQA